VQRLDQLTDEDGYAVLLPSSDDLRVLPLGRFGGASCGEARRDCCSGILAARCDPFHEGGGYHRAALALARWKPALSCFEKQKARQRETGRLS
jgi:hypothetical protein